MTSRRILGSHASVGAIPYYNGFPGFSATGAGSAYQVLSLDPTGKIPGWSPLEGTKLIYASSGSADAVITNLPENYNDILIRAWGVNAAPSFESWTHTSGTITTNVIRMAYFGIDSDSTFTTTTIAGAGSAAASIPVSGAWSATATYGAAFEAKILDYANLSGNGTVNKPIIAMSHNAPGSGAIQGFKVWNGYIPVPNATDKITGFTVNITGATTVYVYVTR